MTDPWGDRIALNPDVTPTKTSPMTTDATTGTLESHNPGESCSVVDVSNNFKTQALPWGNDRNGSEKNPYPTPY